MAKEVNSNFDILGSLNLSIVPNSTGTIVTWNSSTRAIGTRSNTQILADLGITTVISNSHVPVTIATANGLSLSGQALSLGLSGASSTGALSSAHWNIFNSKFDLPSGGTANHYLNGTGSWSLFPNIPAQVNLIQGTGILITGTYPNLTITNTAPNVNQTLSVGATAGSLSISMGNSVALSSLSPQGRQDADVRRNEHSFVPYLAS